jgi:hypothetical protein
MVGVNGSNCGYAMLAFFLKVVNTKVYRFTFRVYEINRKLKLHLEFTIALNSKPSSFTAVSLTAYTETELKANTDEASFCFRPDTSRHTSDRNVSVQTATHLTFITILPPKIA